MDASNPAPQEGTGLTPEAAGADERGVGTAAVRAAMLTVFTVGVAGALACLAVFAFRGDPVLLLLAAALLPVPLLLAPLLARGEPDFLNPLCFVALSALFGVTLRTFYLVFSDDAVSRKLLLQEHPPEFLLPAALLIDAAVASLVVSYWTLRGAVPLRGLPLLRRRKWSRGLYPVVGLLILAGAGCLLLYAGRLDIDLFDLGGLSAKRSWEAQNAGIGTGALGYHRWGMSLLSFAFYLAWAELASSRRSLTSARGLVVLGIGLLAAFPPFLTSSRKDVVALLIYAAVIWHYARRRLRVRDLMAAAAAGLVLVTVMTSLRAQGRSQRLDRVELGLSAIARSTLGNRNFLGIAKTAHIMRAVPEEIAFQNGRTLWTWIFAPVPRSLWPEKPPVRPGAILGPSIFRTVFASGVPPGFVGELYLNFGLYGVLAGMAGVGAALKLLHSSFRPLLETHGPALVVYAVCLFPLSYGLVSSDLSGVVIEIARSLVTLSVVLPFASSRR